MLYKYQDSNGRTVYADRPPTTNEAQGQVEVYRSGQMIRREEPAKEEESPYQQAVGLIGKTQSHVPKIQAYVEYLEYLRKMQPARYGTYLKDLAKNDPESYANLMKAGVFRPLSSHQRLSIAIDASVAVGGDLFTGKSGFSGATTYAEKTLVEYMKRDGFLPPDVLGAKASTLPRSVPNYSNTRLGQWAKQQAAQTEQASKAALAATSGRPVLAAGATAATRVAGPVLDAMIGALDPATFSGASAIFGPTNLKKNLSNKGISLLPEEEEVLRGLFARGDYESIKNIIREAALRSAK